MPRFLNAGVAAACALVIGACEPAKTDEPVATGSVAAQGTGFDFYVLSLSWSPSYCAAEGAGANRQQCGANRNFGFIAHGLWPQFEHGYPQFCPSNQPDRVANDLVATVADIMPSAGLVGHQWRKHGVCTGLDQADYLAAVREAFDSVTIPAIFAKAAAPHTISAADAERAFVEANPSLEVNEIAVTCESGRLSEVRICLSKDLSFRPCAEVDARSCRAPSLAVPQAP